MAEAGSASQLCPAPALPLASAVAPAPGCSLAMTPLLARGGGTQIHSITAKGRVRAEKFEDHWLTLKREKRLQLLLFLASLLIQRNLKGIRNSMDFATIFQMETI